MKIWTPIITDVTRPPRFIVLFFKEGILYRKLFTSISIDNIEKSGVTDKFILIDNNFGKYAYFNLKRMNSKKFIKFMFNSLSTNEENDKQLRVFNRLNKNKDKFTLIWSAYGVN